eukprot:gnl/TRDRNA2_/TRDRNA2_165337_c2_seq3.p1 gnl/TRDRNA2_/TRDRNA2_165337_c2~~gnl/TRDRNA2_/TRDRNA2_165337_c2_seq3.p1  ORF type:complete len:500 (+),score=65.36 gnl/TRDRNA2_/TRDRNA2_165337_c2_seq3:680-2179(+)
MAFIFGPNRFFNAFDFVVVALSIFSKLGQLDIHVSIGRAVRSIMWSLRILRSCVKLLRGIILRIKSGWTTYLFQPANMSCIYLSGIMDHHTGILPYLLQSRSPQLFESILVKAVLEFKWYKFARKQHLFNLLVYVTHACSWMAYSVVTFNGWEDRSANNSVVHKDILAIVTCGFSLSFLSIEVKKIRGSGIFMYIESPWNLSSLSAYTIMCLTTILECVNRQKGNHINLAAVASLLTWCNILYYLRGFRGTGALVSMILQIMSDMRYFTLIMAIMTIAYVQVFFILGSEVFEPDQPLELLWVLYQWGWLGGGDATFGDTGLMERFMFVGMTALMLLVLLNLLIAIMGDTFTRVQESSIVEFYHTFAELIYELEMLMSHTEHSSMKYFPNYMFYSRVTASGTMDAGDESDISTAPHGHTQSSSQLKGIERRMTELQLSNDQLRTSQQQCVMELKGLDGRMSAMQSSSDDFSKVLGQIARAVNVPEWSECDCDDERDLTSI